MVGHFTSTDCTVGLESPQEMLIVLVYRTPMESAALQGQSEVSTSTAFCEVGFLRLNTSQGSWVITRWGTPDMTAGVMGNKAVLEDNLWGVDTYINILGLSIFTANMTKVYYWKILDLP